MKKHWRSRNEELTENVNGEAEFSFRLITAFEANVALATDKMIKPVQNTARKNSGVEKSVEKSVEKIVMHLKDHPHATQKDLETVTGLSRRGVEKNLMKLKELGRIRRIGTDKGGHWEVAGNLPPKQVISEYFDSPLRSLKKYV